MGSSLAAHARVYSGARFHAHDLKLLLSTTTKMTAAKKTLESLPEPPPQHVGSRQSPTPCGASSLIFCCTPQTWLRLLCGTPHARRAPKSSCGAQHCAQSSSWAFCARCGRPLSFAWMSGALARWWFSTTGRTWLATGVGRANVFIITNKSSHRYINIRYGIVRYSNIRMYHAVYTRLPRRLETRTTRSLV